MANKTKKTHIDLLDPFEQGLEAVRSISGHVKKGAKTEADATTQELLAQMFGSDKSGGKIQEHNAPSEKHEPAQAVHGGEIFNAKHHKSEHIPVYADKAPHHKQEAAMDYHGQFKNEIIHVSEKASKTEMHEMKRNVEQIKAELSKLVASSEMLKLQFAEIGVEQTSQNVGTYHLNLFEWMLAVIRSAREKVEDSNAWLGTVKGKGAKKDYWGMFKKHGTNFGLSGERAVATSVG
jgi:hypothetical protein